jgi:probable phosphoglycerate mutase
MHLYVVRHGETRWNVERRLQGRNDSPLTRRGLEQVESYGMLLRMELQGAPAVHLCSSPLPRARQSASILCEMLELPASHYSESELLVERACGSWEGLSWEEIEAKHGEGARSRWRQWDAAISEGGESLAQVHARAKAWLSLPRPDAPTIIVTHGVMSRVFRGAYLDMNEADTLALESHVHETVYALTRSTVRTLRSMVTE